MSDGWLRYAAPDQVPGLRGIDRRARPWREVPDAVRCPACLGALPPDTEAACRTCGTGTPIGLTVPRPLGARSAWATFPNPPAVLDEEHVFTVEEMAALPPLVERAGEHWLIDPLLRGPQARWVGVPAAEQPPAAPHGDMVVTMRQGTFTPTGPPIFSGDLARPPAPLPWWRRMWRGR